MDSQPAVARVTTAVPLRPDMVVNSMPLEDAN